RLERKTAVTRSWLIACLAVIMQPTDVCAQQPYSVSVPTSRGSPAPVSQRHKIAARGGIKLVVYEWRPAEATDHAPAVVFVHGIGMHGEPYSSVATGLTARGITFVVPDLRGHGRSEGKRGELVPRTPCGRISGRSST